MKIVINSCFGGFSLSPRGLQRYLQIKGRDAYFYKQTRYKHSDGKVEYTRIDNINDVPNMFFVCTSYDQGAKIENYPKDSVSHYNFKRNDPILIQVVEELGSEASGACANLKIVDIEKGRWFKIDEYDGFESIEYRDIDDDWILAD
jgi:hypothetical protein